jgi:hypothetical protein
VLGPGDPAPDLTLFGPKAAPAPLSELWPALIVFYLYDWTST